VRADSSASSAGLALLAAAAEALAAFFAK